MSVSSVLQNFNDSFYSQDRIIVLGHDAGYSDHTAEALPAIIEKIQKAGYTFDKLDITVAPIIQGQN